MEEDIQRMLAATSFAVVGASRSPRKYGFLVYQSLKAAHKIVYAVNPNADTLGTEVCYPSLSTLPQPPQVAVMVVPPASTETAILEAHLIGTRNVWMQTGSESDAAVLLCRRFGMAVVYGGPCILVGLKTFSYRSSDRNYSSGD